MTAVPDIPLNNGVAIPQLGLGTDRPSDEETRRIVGEALEVGYRFVDTAASYENERGVGQAFADSGLPREEVFVSTKLRGHEPPGSRRWPGRRRRTTSMPASTAPGASRADAAT